MWDTEVSVRSRLIERMLVVLARSDESLGDPIPRSTFCLEVTTREVRRLVWNLVFIRRDRVIDVTLVRPRNRLTRFDRRGLRLKSEVAGHRDGLGRR